MNIRPIRLLLWFAVIALCLDPLSAQTYTWSPAGTADSAANGGSATWTTNATQWWDGAQAIAAGSSSTPFGSATQNATLVFNGSGTIVKQFTANFGDSTSRTHTLSFTAGSNYTILGLAGGSPFIGSGKPHMLWSVAPTAVLTLGGDGNQLAIVSGSDVSAGPGLVFDGGGAVTLADGALLRNNSRNSRLTIRGGTTLTFETGSLYTGQAGTLTTGYTDLSRLSLESGTVNVNGGTLNTGYAAGTASTTTRSFAIMIGGVASGAQPTFNLNSGTVLALGDPRGSGIAYSGLGFGGSVSNIGGTVNLNGGNLIVTNIRSLTGLANSMLNLNGGTITVTTAQSATVADVTDAMLQTRLDEFVTGFAGTATNRIAIGAGGVTFDTAQIDTARTNGIATVKSGMEGVGGLTKIGANTLRLSGVNTYSGTTHIAAGTLALGATGRLASGTIAIDDGATFDVREVTGGFRLATDQTLAVGGTGIFTGTLGLGGDGTADAITLPANLNLAADSALLFDLGATGDMLTLGGSLNIMGSVTLEFNALPDFAGGVYTLAVADSISGAEFLALAEDSFAPGYIYELLVSSTTLSLAVTAVPEPATYALGLGAFALVLALWLRRRHS